MKQNNSGCAMIVVVIFIIGAILWVVGVALWLLAIAVPIVGLLYGGNFLVQAWAAREVAQNSRVVDAELEALARDASFDLAETITRWDTLILTKGIGTQLQGRDEQAAGIHRQLIAAHQALHAVTTPRHRIEAVLHADTLRATAQSFL